MKKKQKKTENQCQNAATENKKPLVRYVIFILKKNFHWLNRKIRPRMDYEWIEKCIF